MKCYFFSAKNNSIFPEKELKASFLKSFNFAKYFNQYASEIEYFHIITRWWLPVLSEKNHKTEFVITAPVKALEPP